MSHFIPTRTQLSERVKESIYDTVAGALDWEQINRSIAIRISVEFGIFVPETDWTSWKSKDDVISFVETKVTFSMKEGKSVAPDLALYNNAGKKVADDNRIPPSTIMRL